MRAFILPPNNENRILGLDAIRSLACFLVVLFHLISLVLEDATFTPPATHFSSVCLWLFYLSIAHLGVPCFFFISGHFMLNREDNIGAFYKKKLPRFIGALIFWSVFYVIAEHYYKLWAFDETTPMWENLSNFFKNPLYYHLWFLHVFIALLLITPFLQRVVRYIPERHVFLMIFFWWLFELALPALSSFTDWFSPAFINSPMLKHCGYYIIGAYLYRLKDHPIFQRTPMFWLFISIVLLQSVASASLYIDNRLTGDKDIDYTLLTYLSPLTPITSIIFFVFIARNQAFIERASLFAKETMRFIARHSFTIYLSHIVPLTLYVDGIIGNRALLFQHPSIMIPLSTCFVFFLCVLFAAGLDTGLRFLSYLIPRPKK